MNKNIDREEINKFEKIATQWWNATGEFKPLHDINPLRLAFIQSHIALTNKKIIDIGCGGGILAESLAKNGACVTGIDMSPESLKAAEHHLQQSQLSIHYFETTAETMATTHPETFEAATCMELLEHVPNPASLIQACADMVKPGGHIFFSTINRNVKAYLFAILGAEYLLKLLPSGTHDYNKFIRPAEFAIWARKSKLEIVEFKGISYNPLTKCYRLSSDMSVNYLVCCRREA